MGDSLETLARHDEAVACFCAGTSALGFARGARRGR